MRRFTESRVKQSVEIVVFIDINDSANSFIHTNTRKILISFGASFLLL